MTSGLRAGPLASATARIRAKLDDWLDGGLVHGLASHILDTWLDDGLVNLMCCEIDHCLSSYLYDNLATIRIGGGLEYGHPGAH